MKMETSPVPVPKKDRIKNHPLVRQIRHNLNFASIGSIVSGGPERWRHVATQITTKTLPKLHEREAQNMVRQTQEHIKKADLSPITFQFEYEDTPFISVGCELPSDRDYSLIIPSTLQKAKAPELASHISRGNYIFIPATTSEEGYSGYFNNGFFLLEKDGAIRQITSRIEPFKGAIGISFKEDDKSGSLGLLSQTETQDLLFHASSRSSQFPSGGIVLGTSLYTQFNSKREPTMEDAIQAVLENRYFESYNDESPCYIQVGQKIYYFNIIQQKGPGQRTIESLQNMSSSLLPWEDISKKTLMSQVILGVYGALQVASKIKQLDSPVKIAMVEQNYSGRLQFNQIHFEEYYPAYSLIAGKLKKS